MAGLGLALAGEDLFKRFYLNGGVHPSSLVGVGSCPGLGLLQRIEFGYHQAAGETGLARIVAVDGRVRPGEYQPPLILQCLQALQVGRAGFQAFGEAGRVVGGNDRVQHERVLNKGAGAIVKARNRQLAQPATICHGIIVESAVQTAIARKPGNTMPIDIDLHCHSTASDGALSPTALVQHAHARGVRVLALTDHDTLEGLLEARQAAAALGMQLVNGVELSCTWGGATIHVLGYDFAEAAPALQQALGDVHRGRWARAEEIGERLAQKGMPGAFAGARALQQALGDSDNAPARPHFADFLVQAGYVRDRAEAFRKWLGAGKLGDVKQHWPSLQQAVACLRAAGAWVSLAHPMHYEMTRSKRRRLVSEFIAAGGQGLEVSNGLQPAEQVGSLAILAREFGLLASAGSDFHAQTAWSEPGWYRPLPDDLPLLSDRFASLRQVA